MDWFEKLCSLLPAPDVVLHIGAGSGSDLSAYQRFAGARTILVEPEPRMAAKLRGLADQQNGFEVFELAIGAESGKAKLNVFNFSSLNSLRRPCGLDALLPGLAQTGQIEVEVRSLADLVQSLGLEPQAKNWLVLEAPGSEPDIVSAIVSAEGEPIFSRIFLRSGAEALFEGGASASRLAGYLESRGYRMPVVPDDSDPDWPRLYFCYDEQVGAVKELTATVVTLSKQSEELARTRSQLEQALEQQKGEFELKVTALDQSKQALEESKRSQEQKINALSVELGEKAQEVSTVAELDRQQADRIKGLESELLASTSHVSDLETELKSARADLAVSLRNQALRDADLKDLQERYAELSAVNKQQRDLLIQLGQRLGTASEYLKQLRVPGGEVGDSMAAERLVKTLVGDS